MMRAQQAVEVSFQNLLQGRFGHETAVQHMLQAQRVGHGGQLTWRARWEKSEAFARCLP